jgi:uncharacterized protein
MSKTWCDAVPAGVRLSVQVTPNAKKSEATGIVDDVLKIRLQAQPIEGKANEALIRYLAEMLGVPRSSVQITHGLTGRRKTVELVVRLTPDEIRRLLFPVKD